MLPIDGKAAGPLNPKSQNLLRLQAFLKICNLWRNMPTAWT